MSYIYQSLGTGDKQQTSLLSMDLMPNGRRGGRHNHKFYLEIIALVSATAERYLVLFEFVKGMEMMFELRS